MSVYGQCGPFHRRVPASRQFRLNLDQTLNTMFWVFFSSVFSFGRFCITKQSALRLVCLFGVNEWCVKHLEWCMVSIREWTRGSYLFHSRLIGCNPGNSSVTLVCWAWGEVLGFSLCRLHEWFPKIELNKIWNCKQTHMHRFPRESPRFTCSELWR